MGFATKEQVTITKLLGLQLLSRLKLTAPASNVIATYFE
jgi:hypothetical protein